MQTNKDNNFDKNNTLAGKRFLTAPQVAKLIGKHTKWLERKRWEGGGPEFRYIGKSPIYEEQDVINWIENIPKVMNTSQLS
jgi:hypothetical protein